MRSARNIAIIIAALLVGITTVIFIAEPDVIDYLLDRLGLGYFGVVAIFWAGYTIVLGIWGMLFPKKWKKFINENSYLLAGVLVVAGLVILFLVYIPIAVAKILSILTG